MALKDLIERTRGEGAAASSSPAITLRQGAKNNTTTTTRQTYQQVQANASATRAAAAAQLRQNSTRALSGAEENILRGFTMQHPEILQTTYDNIVRSGNTAYQALNDTAAGDSLRRLTTAKTSLADMRESLNAMRQLRQVFGADLDDEEDSISNLMRSAYQGYDRMSRELETQTARLRQEQEQRQSMLAEPTQTRRSFAEGPIESPGWDPVKYTEENVGKDWHGPRSGWAGNVAEAAAKDYVGGMYGSLLTVGNALGESRANSRGKDREKDELAFQRDSLIRQRQGYIDDSTRRGKTPDETMLAWYDEQIARYDPAKIDEGIEQGRQFSRAEREKVDRLAQESETAKLRAAETANKTKLLNWKPYSGKLGNVLGIQDMTLGEVLTDASVAGLEMLGDMTIGAVTGGGNMAPMVVRSFGGAATEAARNGADVGEQIWQGTKNAAIEWFTEKLFGGNPVYDQGGGLITDAAYNLLYRGFGEETMERMFSTAAAKVAKVPMGMLAEGLEEVLSDTLNPLVDSARNWIRGEGWQYEKPDRATLAKDFMVGAALGGFGNVTNAATGAVTNTVQDIGAGRTILKNGAVSGLADAAGYVGQDVNVSQQSRARDVGKAFRAVQEAYLSTAVENRLAEMGVETNADMVEAVKRMAEDRALTPRQQQAYFGNFAETRAVMEEYRTAMEGRVGADNAWAADALIRAEDLSGERVPQTRQVKAPETERRTAPETVKPVDEDAGRTWQREVSREVTQRERAEIAQIAAADDILTAFSEKTRELTLRMHEATAAKDYAAANAYEEILDEMNDLSERASRLPPEQRADLLRETINNNYGGIENGRTENREDLLPDDAGRRGAGESAGVEAGGVRPVGYGDYGQAQTDRGPDRPAFAVEQEGSPAELNIPTGTETGWNKLITRSTWTDAMTSTAEMFRARGYETHYVMGPIEVRSPDGKVRKVDALISGNQVWAQADNARFSGDQNALHEYFHACVAEDPAIMTDLRERFIETHGAEELRDIVARYVQIYDFMYEDQSRSVESMTSDELAEREALYMEEYFADATANKNRASLGRKGAGRDAAMVWEVLQAREGMGRAGDGVQGTRYMAAGENARTADRGALSRAEEMEKQGVDSEQIRQETGWYRGYDGKWRFEISDADAKYHRHGDAQALQDHPAFARHQELMEKLLYGTLEGEEESELRRLDDIWGSELGRLSEIVDKGQARLDMILDHPALFEAYPELRDVRVRFAEMDAGDKASYNPKNRTITLREDLKGDNFEVMRSLVHEIQHAVQHIEGFATGASVEYWEGEPARIQQRLTQAQNRYDELKKEQDAIWDQVGAQEKFDEMIDDGTYSKEAFDAWLFEKAPEARPVTEEKSRLLDEIQRLGQRLKQARYDPRLSEQKYEATAGEIEARDAANRRNLTDEQRKNTRPDIDREDVVFAGNAVEALEAVRHIKDQIRENQDRLNDMDTVASVSFAGSGNKSVKQMIPWMLDQLKSTGFRVDRKGFGTINFGQKQIATAAHYIQSDAEIGAILALPRVLKRGIQIYEETNHNDRRVKSFTIAAPIELNGKRGNMAVVVQRTNGNNYHAHRILAPDGSSFVLDMNEDTETVKGRGDSFFQDPSQLPDSSVSKDSIRDSSENSNPEVLGLRSRFDDLTEADRQATAAREAANNVHDSAKDARNSAENAQTRKPETRYSVAEDEGEIGERAYDEAEAGRLAANIESMTPTELRRALDQDRHELETLERYEKKGYLSQEMKDALPELRRRVAAEQARLKDIDAKAREERKSAQERAVKRQIPTRAKEDFVRDTLDHFSVQTGRQEAGGILGAYFDRVRERGRENPGEREALFRRLIETGTVRVDADESARNIRADLGGTRIYVPEDVRTDFGDNYELLRRRAFANGVILTNDKADNRIDALNAELADRFPGTFRTDVLDRGAMLEGIVNAAEQGRAENISLMEMLQRNQSNEGWTVDDQLDRMADWLDNRIDKALYAAGIEVREKAKGAMQLAKERQERREAMARQSEQRQLREQQHKTMKALQWLKKNRSRSPEDLRAKYDEVLSDINLYTMSAANEMRWSEKHQATYGDLVAMYKDAQKNDPNWLPSKELERLMSMVDGKAIADMDIDELDTLYKAATALRTEFYNRNNVINDELHRTFAEVYDGSTEEIRGSGGKGSLGKGLAKLMNEEMQTPINVLHMMGGRKKDGTWFGMARQLQSGERARKGYVVQSRALLDEFKENHKDWIRKADGQGKDAIWYEVEIPELMELHMGDKPIFGDTVTVYMTPMQKVQLYLESKNYQNLQHMTGGRTFVDKELQSRGKTAEALAQGTTVRLAPETVKKLVSNLTTEEQELANILERYYNERAKTEINRVSNTLYGYDKAMIDYYAPIFTDQNYNKTTAGLIDVTAEGVGHMKSREQVSKNPSYNLSAIDAFEKHVDQTSRFVGFAIPIRNMETLMNWYGDGTTMKKTISRMWGKEGVDYVTDLMTKLQSPTVKERSVLQVLGDKAVGNYITAVFGMNPGIVLKQAASYPAAGAVLGFGNMPSVGQMARVDEDLIAKYTPELAYRKMGMSTPEIAEMKKNPSVLDRNPVTRFLLRGGAIQAMDTQTVKNLWPWAENYVRKNNPELEVGDQATVDAGASPFYKKVAEIFNEAVNVTQPMYDVMNRAKIMDSDNLLTKTFTMFKTVPLQEYNTLRRYMGEAKDGGKAGKRAAAGAVASVLASTLALEAVEALNALVKNGMKYYKDDDDELTAESFAKEYGMNVAKDLAGIMIGGSELFEAITHTLGLGGYSNDFTVIGSEQINEMKDAMTGAATLLEKTMGGAYDVAQNGGSVKEYLQRNRGDLLGGIHDLATVIAKYAGGIPVENTEKYLGGILAKAWPEAKAVIGGAFDTTTKKDLSYIDADELPTRLGDLLAIRGIDTDDGTSEELARLYTAGMKNAVPADTPTKIGERELTAYEMQVFDNAYSKAVGENLDKLVESDAYIDQDDEGRAAMLESLYSYAASVAKAEVDPDYEMTSFAAKANEAGESGIDVVTYIAADRAKKAADAANDGNGTITQAEAEEALRGMDLTNEQRSVLWQLTNKSWSAKKNPFSSDFEETETTGTKTSGTKATETTATDGGKPAAPDPTDRDYLKSLTADLDPPEGMTEVTKTQKYRAYIDAFESVDDQVAALETIMSDSELRKIEIGRSRDVTPSMYVASKVEMYAADDANDNNNTVTQMEAKWALDSMDLTNDQKAVLWQLTNKSWKPYGNPYNSDIGMAVYDELHGAELQNPVPVETAAPHFALPTVDTSGGWKW